MYNLYYYILFIQQSFLCKKKVVTLLLFLLLNTFVGFSQTVTTAIDSTEIKIGSQANFSITTTVKKTDSVRFPKGTFLGGLEILESYPVDTTENKTDKNKITLLKKYGITQFDSGTYAIPPLQVIINNKTFRTDSISVLVNPVTVDTTKQKMYDIKPIITTEKPTDYWWLYFLLIVLAITLLGIGLYFFIKKRQKKKNTKEAVLFASPIEKALNHLQKLDKQELWKKGEIKSYYSELTDIARIYIEEAIAIPAMESTSNELFKALKQNIKTKKIPLNKTVLHQFKKVLTTSDLVKFAKSKPLLEEVEEDKKTINTFLISLDKSLPRTEDEKEQLFIEERKNKRDKKQKIERILIPVAAMIMLFSFVALFFITTKGIDYARENWIGHNAKSLLNQEWVTSTYGEPGITVATPKALKRTKVEQGNMPNTVKEFANFMYGSITDNFYIVLKTVAFANNETTVDLETVLEGNLKQLEILGASNLIVKMADYEDPNGLTGKIAKGTYTITTPNETEPQKMKYQILVFGQKNGMQELWLTCKENDKYAKEIMERVLHSVELKKIPTQ